MKRLALLALVLAGCGSSTPASSPTAAATPTPAATPSPNPTVGAYGCPLPSLPDLKNQCPTLTPQYSDIVNAAIDKTVGEHPEYFDLNDSFGGSNYRVLDRSKYIGTVVKNIQAKGVCSREELEEIQVKTTNEFNEQYNIWTSAGYIRRAPGAYITTCFPAQF